MGDGRMFTVTRAIATVEFERKLDVIMYVEPRTNVYGGTLNTFGCLEDDFKGKPTLLSTIDQLYSTSPLSDTDPSQL